MATPCLVGAGRNTACVSVIHSNTTGQSSEMNSSCDGPTAVKLTTTAMIQHTLDVLANAHKLPAASSGEDNNKGSYNAKAVEVLRKIVADISNLNRDVNSIVARLDDASKYITHSCADFKIFIRARTRTDALTGLWSMSTSCV